MKNPDYYNHVDEDFADYYGYTQRHKRAVDYVNNKPVNAKPGISPKLVKIAIASVCVAGLIVLIGKLFG